jgi:hypothetical protein
MTRGAPALLLLMAACGPIAGGSGTALPAAPHLAATSLEAARAPRGEADTRTAAPLDAREVELERRLRDRGVSAPMRVGIGFLASRESAVHEVVVPGGTCATFTAIATDGIRDLDASLHHPSGEMLAADTAEDAHPTVQVCATDGAPRRFALRVVNFRGHGAYRLLAFPSAEAALSAIASALGGTPGRVRDRDADPVAARVAERMDTATRRGFVALGEPREIALAAAQSVWVPVPLRAGRCLLAFVLPQGGLASISARLLDGDGIELARSDDTATEAMLQFCAERQRELILVLTARRGAGTARVLTFTAPAARLGGGSYLWFGQTSSRLADVGSASEHAHPRDCAALVRTALTRAEAAGFRAAGAPRCVSLARRESESTRIPIEAGECLRVELVADSGVARPAVTLTIDGAPLAEHVGPGLGAPAIVHACSATSRELDATLVARSGSGALGLVVTRRPTEGPDLAAEAHRLDAGARAVAAGLAPAPDEDGACASASLRSVDVVAGTCARMTFVAERGAPVSLCATHDGVSVACDAGSAPEVALCAPPDVLRRVELRCAPREGDAARGRWLVATRRLALGGGADARDRGR